MPKTQYVDFTTVKAISIVKIIIHYPAPQDFRAGVRRLSLIIVILQIRPRDFVIRRRYKRVMSESFFFSQFWLSENRYQCSNVKLKAVQSQVAAFFWILP